MLGQHLNQIRASLQLLIHLYRRQLDIDKMCLIVIILLFVDTFGRNLSIRIYFLYLLKFRLEL